jgi:hypothetical protein
MTEVDPNIEISDTVHVPLGSGYTNPAPQISFQLRLTPRLTTTTATTILLTACRMCTEHCATVRLSRVHLSELRLRHSASHPDFHCRTYFRTVAHTKESREYRTNR